MVSLPSMRIKVELSDETENNHSQNSSQSIKFVYAIALPSNKTIDELIQILQKYINQQFINKNIQIVQLTTDDGFILSKSDICSAVLKDNDHIMCIDMKKFVQETYSTIDFDNLWGEFKQHDASDDQEKFIQIGLNTFSKLFIKIFGNSNTYGIYIFSVFELITIASEKNPDNLIARLDSKDDEDDTSSADWFIEVKWEYDAVSNKDLFIISNLKVGSSDEIFSNKLHIRLDHSRMRISKGDISRLSGETSDSTTLTDQQRQRLAELAAKLPPPKRTGPQINLNNNETLKVGKHECEGESSIRMAYGNTNTVTTCQDLGSREDGTLRQHFRITHIIFSKKPLVLPEILNQKRSQPVDKPVSVASLTVFYQMHDGSWRECQEVAIAPIAARNEEPQWLTDSIINIEPDKLISFIIKGWLLVKGIPGRDNNARNRTHRSLPQPFKLKIVTTDNFGKQCSLVVEQLNKPLSLPTPESYLKNNQSNINELLGFVYADDCELDERIYMASYLDNKNALVVKHSEGRYLTYERKVLRTIEFNAKHNKTVEILLDTVHYDYGGNEMKAFFLFDPETYILYAVRLEVITKTSKSEQTIPIPLEKIKQ